MKDNVLLERFERDVGGEIVYASYRLQENILSILYVEAPPALRGTGEAGRLMQDIVEYARSQNYRIVPVCGYAASWIRRHSEFQDLLA